MILLADVLMILVSQVVRTVWGIENEARERERERGTDAGEHARRLLEALRSHYTHYTHATATNKTAPQASEGQGSRRAQQSRVCLTLTPPTAHPYPS